MTAQQRLSTELIPVRLTAQDYRLLAEAGVFEKYAKTELIEGEIWAVQSIWRWHARVHAAFMAELFAAVRASGLELTVYGPGSIAMSDDSMPEPDISVATPETDAKDPISLAAVLIAIELSDTTRVMDLGRKADLYARHGVAEYWVADRETQTLFLHSAPAAEAYRQIDKIAFGEPVQSMILPELTVSTQPLLG